VPMLPVPMVPLEPEEPLVPMLPLLEEPLLLSMPEPLDEPVLPLLLEPELLLCFFAFFLLDLWVVDLPVVWSDCELALVVSPVEELPLVCACAFMVPNIAIATEAPNRPFSNLFIFMSIS